MFEAAQSTEIRNSVAPRAATTRSRITNGKSLLAGIDARSAGARRYRDLVQAYAEPLGGLEGLGATDAALVREIASVSLQSEAMAASLARGDGVDPEQSVRVANVLSRLVSRLERRKRISPKLSVPEYLAARDARKAEGR
jgi:hypothetical protein